MASYLTSDADQLLRKYEIVDCDSSCLLSSESKVETNNDKRLNIFLMGPKGSGKTSIYKVIFQNLAPTETLLQESTTQVQKYEVTNSEFIKYNIWDYPAHFNTTSGDSIFNNCDVLIYVIDVQEFDWEMSKKLNRTIIKAYQENPTITIEVFIHKIEGANDDQRFVAEKQIQDSFLEYLEYLEEDCFDELQVSFHLTSIYDSSIFEVFSIRVVQNLIPQLSTLENLLNTFVQRSEIRKAFLFDVPSRLYVATDSSPTVSVYEICRDVIDVVIDMSGIYGRSSKNDSSTIFDSYSESIIRLNSKPKLLLFLREVHHMLAIVCIIGPEDFNKGLVYYNLNCFKQGIQRVLDIRKRT